MAVSLSQLTAQTATREIGGKQYVFSPITLADLAAIQAWYCELPLDDCEKQLLAHALIYEVEEIKEMKDAAKSEYKKRLRVMNKIEKNEDVIEAVQADMMREFGSIRGVAQFAYLSLRHADPSITEKQAADLLDIESLEAITDLLDILSMPQVNREPATIVEEVAACDEKKTA